MRLILWLVLMVSCSFAQANQYITLGSYKTYAQAHQALEEIKENGLIKELSKRHRFELSTQNIDQYFSPMLYDFNNTRMIPLIYGILKHDYPDIKIDYDKDYKATLTSTTWFFMTLLIMIVYVSALIINHFYTKYKTIKEDYERLQKLKETLSTRHDEILKNLGYKIERSTNDMIHARDKIINEPINELTPQTIRHKFKAIQETDKILTDTTNQMIDFLKAKSGKLKLTYSSFDINQLLESITMHVEQNYKGDSVELIYEVNLNVWHYMVGDFKRLYEILVNIIDYSYRNTTSGIIKLVVSTFEQDEKSFSSEFKIIDNSVGVHKSEQEKIFLPFHDPHAKRGLFLSKEFAQLMGGTLNFVSRYGKGNIFSITIPLKRDEEHEQNYKLISARFSTKELQGKYIGIIEKDERVSLAIQKAFLHSIKNVQPIAHYSLNDYDVINRFDLVLVEHSMINSSLLTLFKSIQQNKEFHVIAMHTILSTQHKEIIDPIIERYITKPISPSNALKFFLDAYKQPKIVTNEEEIVFMEQMDRHLHSDLPKQFLQELPETIEATKSFLKDYLGSSLLIIDDNVLHQKEFDDMIFRTGIKYAQACNAKRAIEELESYYSRFDLIFINLEVEHDKGLIIAKMIRSNESYRRIPIVAIGNGEFTPMEITQTGINAFFNKPITVSKVYTALHYYLAKADLGAPFAKLTQSEHILDITRGIMQASHNEALYLELLQEFQNVYGVSGETIKALIEVHDYRKMKELVVSMIGISNIMGANDMYRLLNELESLLQHQRYNKLSNYVSRYVEELEHLNTSIEIYIRSVRT